MTEKEKKSLWKWVAGSVLADEYVDYKIKREMESRMKNEVDKRVREEVERREYEKEKEARYQAEEEKEEAENKRQVLELYNKANAIMEKIHKCIQGKEKISDIPKFNNMFGLVLEYIDAQTELIDFCEKKGLNRTNFLQDLSDYIRGVCSMFFGSIINSLNLTLNSAKNRLKLSKTELETFNKMLKKWVEGANSGKVTKKEYDKFVEEVKKNKNALEILREIENQIDLSIKIGELDKRVKVLAEKNKLQKEENIEVTIDYIEDEMILEYRNVYFEMQAEYLFNLEGIDTEFKDHCFHIPIKYEKKVLAIIKKVTPNFKILHKKC